MKQDSIDDTYSTFTLDGDSVKEQRSVDWAWYDCLTQLDESSDKENGCDRVPTSVRIIPNKEEDDISIMSIKSNDFGFVLSPKGVLRCTYKEELQTSSIPWPLNDDIPSLVAIDDDFKDRLIHSSAHNTSEACGYDGDEESQC